MENLDFQDEHENFLNFNLETQQIMKVFPTKFPVDQKLREQMLKNVIIEIREMIETFKKENKSTSFIFEKIKILIFQNPFSDVIEHFEALYLEYNKNIEENKASKFYHNEEVPSVKVLAKYFSSESQEYKLPFPSVITISKDAFYNLLAEIFNRNYGKIPQVERLLCWYPDLLQINFESKQCIMLESGPLPLDWRFFIAIMAISCYGCNYYFYRLSQHFLDIGGDKSWLAGGLEAVPKKLKNLQELNSFIAYKPWSLYQSNCIKELLKGKDQWNIPELLHAIVILCYYHSWSCFIFSNGIKLEYDMGYYCEKEGNYVKKRSFDDKGSHFPIFAYDTKNEDIITLLRRLEENEKISADIFNFTEDVSSKLNSNCDTISSPHEEFLNETENDVEEEICGIAFTKFISRDIKTLEEFNLQKYRILHSHEFNFNTHGYSILSEFLPDIAQKIFQEFNTLTKMTKRTFLDAENVNTDPLRISIWYYTHNIYGYYHDHFDYKQVKKLMTKELKQFIKNMVMKPFEINLQNSNNLKIKFFPWEKCHITLLALAAKFEMELIYSLECLNNILTERYN